MPLDFVRYTPDVERSIRISIGSWNRSSTSGKEGRGIAGGRG